MDIKNALNNRTQEFEDFNDTEDIQKYNYGREGILTKTLPKILFKGNSIFVTFVQLIDLRLIMMFKYIDKIKRFKWISWY